MARLDGTSAFQLEAAISALIDGLNRLVDGIEKLDLDKVGSARAKADEAQEALLLAIRLRKEGN